MSNENAKIRPNAVAAESIEAANAAYATFSNHANKAIQALMASGDLSAEETKLVSMLQATTHNAGIVQISLMLGGIMLKPQEGDETTDAPETTGGVQ